MASCNGYSVFWNSLPKAELSIILQTVKNRICSGVHSVKMIRLSVHYMCYLLWGSLYCCQYILFLFTCLFNMLHLILHIFQISTLFQVSVILVVITLLIIWLILLMALIYMGNLPRVSVRMADHK